MPPGFGFLVLAFLFEGTSLLRGLDNFLVSMRLLSFVARKGSTRATMSATDVSETSQLALQASGSGPDQSSASAAAAERQRSILCLKRAWRLAAASTIAWQKAASKSQRLIAELARSHNYVDEDYSGAILFRPALEGYEMRLLAAMSRGPVGTGSMGTGAGSPGRTASCS